ncbi:hypothetical protein E3P77_02469 [Wallemia ichthyophaga]|uniref:ATPase expression protein 2, mitochondrial n=1 Tax=Wallemia ichthyophaga TaxID=245174 RepID=A0A4T0GGK9_WALIC|nr:hypothetical protein E3P96_02803 [Wallemia ichthyophaga]TIB12797.1 hypothetical protein E3P90_01930 [Wallemia ichthyophaga]TIB14389.1 hypothetical protein E3P93_01680 [Wallemia ichthyophaga]TIB23571.1 hypothetical protein E3P89_01484 [Wallemia ichthyophaga]TIB24948.1 hypothetical protein E3P88_01885 [Wallemia ichthyophaga]
MISRFRRGANTASLFEKFTGVNLRRAKNLPRSVRWLYDELELESEELNKNNKIWQKYRQCIDSNQAGFLPLSIHQFVLQRCTNSPPKKFDRNVIERYLHNQDRLRFIIDQMRIHNHSPSLEDYKFILNRFSLMGSRSGCRRIMREILDSGLPIDAACYNSTLMGYVRWIHRQNRNNHKDPRPQRIISAEISGLLEEMANKSIQPNQDTYNYVLSILKDIHDFDGLNQLLQSTYGIDIYNPDHQPIQFLDFLSQNPHISPPKVSPSVLRSIVDAVGNHSNLSTLISVFEALVNPIKTDGVQTYVWKTTPEEESSETVAVNGKNLSVTVFDRLLYHVTRQGPSFLAKHYIRYIISACKEERVANAAFRKNLLETATIDTLKYKHMKIPRIFFSAQLLTSIRLGLLDHHYQKMGVIKYMLEQLPFIMKEQAKEHDELREWMKAYEEKIVHLLNSDQGRALDDSTFNNLTTKLDTDLRIINDRTSTLKLHNRLLNVAGNTWMPQVWAQVAARRRQSRANVRMIAAKEERDAQLRNKMEQDYFVGASAPVT